MTLKNPIKTWSCDTSRIEDGGEKVQMSLVPLILFLSVSALRLVIDEKLFFLLEAQAARKKKIRSPCVIVTTAFPKNNNSAPKAKIPVRSDLMRSPIRSDPKSDPIRSPICNPIQVLLTAPKIKHWGPSDPTTTTSTSTTFERERPGS